MQACKDTYRQTYRHTHVYSWRFWNQVHPSTKYSWWDLRAALVHHGEIIQSTRPLAEPNRWPASHFLTQYIHTYFVWIYIYIYTNFYLHIYIYMIYIYIYTQTFIYIIYIYIYLYMCYMHVYLEAPKPPIVWGTAPPLDGWAAAIRTCRGSPRTARTTKLGPGKAPWVPR